MIISVSLKLQGKKKKTYFFCRNSWRRLWIKLAMTISEWDFYIDQTSIPRHSRLRCSLIFFCPLFTRHLRVRSCYLFQKLSKRFVIGNDNSSIIIFQTAMNNTSTSALSQPTDSRLLVFITVFANFLQEINMNNLLLSLRFKYKYIMRITHTSSPW